MRFVTHTRKQSVDMIKGNPYLMILVGEIGYIFMAYPITWIISLVIYLLYYCLSDRVHGFERSKLNE